MYIHLYICIYICIYRYSYRCRDMDIDIDLRRQRIDRRFRAVKRAPNWMRVIGDLSSSF